MLLFFKPILNNVEKTIELIENSNSLIVSAFIFGILNNILNSHFGIDYFGIHISILVFIFFTIFVNAVYGIKKSLKRSKEYKKLSEIAQNSNDKRRYKKISQRKKFKWDQLEFVFFKCFMVMMYLFMANFFVERIALNENPILKFIDVTAEALIIVPIFVFWYKEFKSIGENAEYYYERKLKFFDVLENIVELKILKLYKKLKK